ncbi:putative TSPO(outer membrane tryptophan-rich sensory protein)-related [Hibiscus syriacus]|uniref:TSPO(Outer membrane tryptophan-rich sensory protein)-related n=1 Tax=Hibiscus syriacus TaxID=106335 RepID=A0A6A3DA76_HIBSY|nr:putative TSPO(outer membrane tryptophan-rich sensory protein)-related [Hibiscus syriacus]
MDGNGSEDKKQDNADMAAFVQSLLEQMQSRFQTMSDSIITKNILFVLSSYFNLRSRIDELEQSINDLRTEMDGETSPSPSVPTGPKDDSKSTKDP